MTAVSEGKSRDVPSRRFAGRREGRGEKGWRAREEKRLSPLIPTIPRRPVPDFRTRRNERRTRGAAGTGTGTGDGMPQMEKKEPGLYFPLTSERKRRSWSTRSSTNCLRGTGLGINLLLAPLYFYLPPPSLPFRSFPAYRLLYSKLYQTSRDARMRSLCSGTKKTWSNLDSQ